MKTVWGRWPQWYVLTLQSAKTNFRTLILRRTVLSIHGCTASVTFVWLSSEVQRRYVPDVSHIQGCLSRSKLRRKITNVLQRSCIRFILSNLWRKREAQAKALLWAVDSRGCSEWFLHRSHKVTITFLWCAVSVDGTGTFAASRGKNKLLVFFSLFQAFLRIFF